MRKIGGGGLRGGWGMFFSTRPKDKLNKKKLTFSNCGHFHLVIDVTMTPTGNMSCDSMDVNQSHSREPLREDRLTTLISIFCSIYLFFIYLSVFFIFFTYIFYLELKIQYYY